MAELTRKARSDAERTRAHPIQVARAAFSEQGLGVTMREVARRAGLGVATVHRHFPSRDDLVRAALVEQVEACAARVSAAAADPDPERGLRRVLEEICTRQSFDRGFVEVLVDDRESVFTA